MLFLTVWQGAELCICNGLQKQSTVIEHSCLRLFLGTQKSITWGRGTKLLLLRSSNGLVRALIRRIDQSLTFTAVKGSLTLSVTWWHLKLWVQRYLVSVRVSTIKDKQKEREGLFFHIESPQRRKVKWMDEQHVSVFRKWNLFVFIAFLLFV